MFTFIVGVGVDVPVAVAEPDVLVSDDEEAQNLGEGGTSTISKGGRSHSQPINSSLGCSEPRRK
jgi:hypothetical protein